MSDRGCRCPKNLTLPASEAKPGNESIEPKPGCHCLNVKKKCSAKLKSPDTSHALENATKIDFQILSPRKCKAKQGAVKEVKSVIDSNLVFQLGKDYFEPYYNELVDDLLLDEERKGKSESGILFKRTFPIEYSYQPTLLETRDDVQIQTELTLGTQLLSNSLNSNQVESKPSSLPWDLIILPPRGATQFKPVEIETPEIVVETPEVVVEKVPEAVVNVILAPPLPGKKKKKGGCCGGGAKDEDDIPPYLPAPPSLPELIELSSAPEPAEKVFSELDEIGHGIEPYIFGLTRDKFMVKDSCQSVGAMPWDLIVLPLEVKIRKIKHEVDSNVNQQKSLSAPCICPSVYALPHRIHKDLNLNGDKSISTEEIPSCALIGLVSSKTVHILTPKSCSYLSTHFSVTSKNFNQEKKSSQLLCKYLNQNLTVSEGEVCEPCEQQSLKDDSKPSERTDPVIEAFKACEAELKPLKVVLSQVKQKLRNLNMPELDCLFQKPDPKFDFQPSRLIPTMDKAKEQNMNDNQPQYGKVQNAVRMRCQNTFKTVFRFKSPFGTPQTPALPPHLLSNPYQINRYPTISQEYNSNQFNQYQSNPNQYQPNSYQTDSYGMNQCRCNYPNQLASQNVNPKYSSKSSNVATSTSSKVSFQMPCRKSKKKLSKSSKRRQKHRHCCYCRRRSSSTSVSSKSSKSSSKSEKSYTSSASRSSCSSKCSRKKRKKTKKKKKRRTKDVVSKELLPETSASQCPFMEAMKSMLLIDNDKVVKNGLHNFAYETRLSSKNVKNMRLRLRVRPSQNKSKRSK